ncbi:HAD family hydrolase [Chiayiivirga flava]|uniref:Putative hydrolase of the HAD superfamily n=1 Tax=Chiayiivirga flava TaxID=659595 RepID=A0A7W8G0X6_9GAMM|nr:putative hydrolase of the HAD superfamily [Chiayiivirga flava]
MLSSAAVTDVPIRALTLDLDDTLWPIWPAIERAEAALHAWLAQHAPATAARYPMHAMRELRDRIAAQNPELAHDFSAQRRLCLDHALRECDDDAACAQAAFDVFYAARNQVDLYEDTIEGLTRLAQRFPLAALTNGNADLRVIGLQQHFVFQLGAREHGAAKPDPGIFHAACARLQCTPDEVLHIGDDPELDVLGAHRAGLRTVWINRRDEPWPHPEQPDFIAPDLHALADWLDALQPPAASDRSTP